MATQTFPDRFRAETFRTLEWALARWRTLLVALIVAILAAGGVGVWWWRGAQREGQAGTALAEVNQAFRKQYPGGFYLPGGEASDARPDALIQRYEQVAGRYAGTRPGAEARLRAAHLEYAAGQYDAAIRDYDRYAETRRAPFRASALLGKGYALMAKGDAAGAVAAFGLAAEAAPKDVVAAEAYLAQGRALESLKKREEALRAYATVTERFSGSGWAGQATERAAALKP